MGGKQQPLLSALAARKIFSRLPPLEFANGREKLFD